MNKAPAVWNKKVEGMVMPKPREVKSAQDTLVTRSSECQRGSRAGRLHVPLYKAD